MLHAYLFGELTLTDRDVPLPAIPSRVARSLLAYLLVYRHRPHTRDLLAGTFWPELPDAAARRRLSQALWQIRRALSPHPILVSEGDGVLLNPDLSFRLDVEEFEELVDWKAGKEGDQPAIPVYQPANLSRLRQAVELYRGDFLAGHADNWLLPERERLREVFVSALEQLAEGHKARGDYGPALLYAGRLARENPWREEAHREVMRLHHLLGQHDEALKQFETCRQALAEELEVEPSPETVALAREIATRSGDAVPPVLAGSLLPPPAILLEGLEAPELPLVGRKAERSALLAHLDALFQGLGGVVLVEGEAGVGKTRLLQAVAGDAGWRGAEVLWAGGQESGAAMPYGPLLAALNEGLSPSRANQLAQLVDEIWLQVLAALLPSLAAALPDLPPPPELEPAQERDRLAAALGQLLAGWARISPLLLVLEDLHWAGEDALDLLVRLIPALGEQAVLLVGSYRSEEARALEGVWPKIQALDRAGVQHKLVLGGLDAATTGELVRRCLGMGSPAPLFASRLHGETQGNPLFVLETLRALRGEGLLKQNREGEWSTPWDEATDDYAELPLPHAVEQVIARRLEMLPPGLERTLHLAAALGERFDFALLQTASGQEPPTLLAALRDLIQRRFVDETAHDYHFSHDKIRQVAYEGIPVPQRLLLHRRAAEAFESLQPDQVAVLAHHWTQAEVWDRAADYHQQAGDRAGAVYAHAEAVAHYTEALAALERLSGPPDLDRIFALRLAREATHNMQGKREAQAQDLAALEALVEQLTEADPQTATEKKITVALHQGNFYTNTSDYASARQHLERALALARAAGDRQAEASALNLLGTAHHYLGDLKTSLDLYRRMLAISQSLGDQRRIAQGLNACASVCHVMEDNAAAQTHCQQALALCQASGDRQGEAYSSYLLSRISRYFGRLSHARAYAVQAIALHRRIGNLHLQAYSLLELGNLQYTLGEYPAARETLEQAATLCRQIGDRRGEGAARTDLGLVYLAQGQAEAARELIAPTVDLFQAIGDRWCEAGALGYLALALERLCDLPSAAGLFEQALAIKREIEVYAWSMKDVAGLARISLAWGQMAEALEHIQEILGWIGAEGIAGIPQPFAVYWTACRILKAAGQEERVKVVLSEAHNLLMEQAGRLDGAADRRSYLENVAEHRELVAAYDEFQASQLGRKIQVRLPRAGAPTGRPLRDDEYVTVTWTVNRQEDEEISGKAQRRRHRLLRLLQEAEEQKAAPTVDDLAAALQVSQPTIRRDLAALRQAGHEVRTRGSRGA